MKVTRANVSQEGGDAHLTDQAAPIEFTPEELDTLFAHYWAEDGSGIPAFIEDQLWVQLKQGGIGQFVLNKGQWKLIRAFQKQWAEKKPVRIIVLKARQIGFSTVIQAINLWYLIRRRNVRSLAIAHERDASANLYEKLTLMLDKLDPAFRPMEASRNNALFKIRFDNPDPKARATNPGLNSSFETETAEDPNAGRSGTFQFIHASEVAFWPHSETFTALLQTIGNKPETVLILESTANGASGNFYEIWKAAEREENDFEPIFVAWWEHDDYRLPMTAEEAEVWGRIREALNRGERPSIDDINALKLDADELDLAKRYPIDYGQIKWRRWAIPNLCEGDLDKFKQEYPSNPDEAFLTSGRPWFDVPTVIRLKEEAREVKPGRYIIDVEQSEALRMPVRVEDPFGELFVFAPPEKGKKYVIGADCSQGEEGGDFDAAAVMEVESMDLVAFIHAQMDPDLYARKLHWLGIWYNRALLGPEINNSMGGAVVNVLEKYTHYPNLWGQGWPLRHKMRNYGWVTNFQTRSIIMGKIKQAIREGVLRPKFLPLLDEMLTFKINEKGKPEAERGQHDDLIMATAIALELREQVAMHTSLRYSKQVVNLGGKLPERPKLRVVPKHPRW